jgi:hypothetical protein
MQSSAPGDGRKHRPKHVELTWNNKLIYTVHLVGYFHSCIKMHGFMNVNYKLNFQGSYLVKSKIPFHVGKSYRVHKYTHTHTYTHTQNNNDRRSLFYLTNRACHFLLLFQFAVIQRFHALQFQHLARLLFIVFK